MPVKVRCSACSKVLNAPDAARGKVIKCPGCEAKVRVPEEDGEEQEAPAKVKAGAKAGAKKPVKKTKSAEDFLSDLDLGNIEDTSSRVCPKCGTESDMEAFECPKCGVEFATGQLSARAARRKGMRGPDPQDFYGVVWKDSWEFMKKNTKLATRTGTYWMLFCVTALNMFVFARMCTGWPPWLYWTGKSILFALGIVGWFWYLNGRIIQHTMAREKKLKDKDVKFDFLLDASLGLKSGAWIFALSFPLVIYPAVETFLYISEFQSAIYAGETKANKEAKAAKLKQTPQDKIDKAVADELANVSSERMKMAWMITVGVSALIGMFVFPVAQVHLTMKHSWQSWALGPMLAAAFNNVGAIVVWWMMALAAFLPVLLIVGGIGFLFYNDTLQYNFDIKMPGLETVLGWCGEKIDAMGFMAYIIAEVYFLVVAFAAFATITYIAAFPAIFVMRANGLFGYYNRERLNLMTVARPKELAGFWPRMVAGMSDFVILAAGGLVLYIGMTAFEAVAMKFDFLMEYNIFEYKIGIHQILGYGGFFVLATMYFIKSESGNEPATPGMRSVGLGVIKEDGTKFTPNQTYGRFFGRILSLALGGFGFLMAAFTPKKQALHDTMTKTLVVWVGDGEAADK
jgi:uncharacterized RDD family membrane protein YckC